MKRPMPLEFRVEVEQSSLSREFGGLMYLYAGTADAENWIKEIAPEFGKLYPPHHEQDCFYLFVNGIYKTQEVAVK